MRKYNFVIILILEVFFVFGIATSAYSWNSHKDNINNNWHTQIYSIPDSPELVLEYLDTWLEFDWYEIEIESKGVIVNWSITYTWHTDGYYGESAFYIKSPFGTEASYITEVSDTYTVSTEKFNGEKSNGKWRLWIDDWEEDGGNQATNITMTVTTMPSFIVTIPKYTKENKGLIQGQIKASPPPHNEIVVNLSASNGSEISVSSSITLSAESHTKYFDIYVGDDDLLDGPSTYTIFASSYGYYTGYETIVVQDNEIASFSIELPETASITDNVITGELIVDKKVDSDIIISLTSDNEYFSVPSSVRIAANSNSVSFSITIEDEFNCTQNISVSGEVPEWISISDTMDVLPILIPDSERQALIDIYNSTNGINWKISDNWMGEHGTECSWYGIECTDNHITEIIIGGVLQENVEGIIPESIGNFQFLSILKLSSGKFSMIPENFKNLQNLTELNLFDNKLNNLPEWFGNLKKLSILDLSSNQLDSLPESFNNLQDLSECNLSNNSFKTIPDCIGNLQNLVVLNLNNNELKNIPEVLNNLINISQLSLAFNQIIYLPDYITTLTKLKSLEIRNNLLKKLPEGFGNLINLDQLYLSSNQLDILPQDISNLQNLTIIHLTDNLLSRLPDNFCKLYKITTLYLSNNKLINLPSEFGDLENIEYLDLQNNKLIGLPESIGKISNLSYLNISNNMLNTLPDSFSEMINLRELDLSNNQLSKLPESFGKIIELYILNLSNNQLRSIPESFGNIENLKSLNLSINELISLPDSFGNLKKIPDLDLSNNNLQALPDTIGNLYQLKYMDLSNNQLSNLPESIGELYSLHRLNLSMNSIIMLPQSISNLIQLKYLNLFNNKIDTIPESIGNLVNLQQLNISDNNISSLPSKIGNLTNVQTLDASKNSLQYLPDTVTYLTSLQRIDISENEINNFPYQLGMLPNLIEIDISFNQINTIKEEILNFQHLTTLNLSNNRSLEVISKNIEKLTRLEYLDLSSCGLINQTLALEIFKLTNLRALSLEDNELSDIPEEIDGLKNLTSLSLANNAIGQITNKSLFNLINLQSLDLSENKFEDDYGNDIPLSGDIPGEILKLENLVFINLTNTILHTSSPIIEQFINERTFNWINNPLFPDIDINKKFEIALITTESISLGYSLNSKVPISIVMTQPATLINGQMIVTVETEENDREFVIQPFSSSYTATGFYTVENGDFSEDLSIKSIKLTDGAILKNSNGEYADLSLPDKNLNIMKNVYVDGTIPDIHISFPTKRCVDNLDIITGSAADISKDFSVKIEITDDQGGIKWEDKKMFYIHSNEQPLINWEFNPPQHIWEYDSSYIVKAIATDFAGNSNYTLTHLTYGKKSSIIEVNLSKNNIIIGQQFNITGNILPINNIVGEEVIIKFTPPFGPSFVKKVYAKQDGSFEYFVKCSDIDQSGIWKIAIEWDGSNCLGASSTVDYSVSVKKSACEVALDATYQAIKLGDKVSITGKVSPQYFCNDNMINIPVILRISNLSNQQTYEKEVLTSDIWGGFVYHAESDFNMLGNWTIQASVRSNSYQDSFSEILNIKVVETSGYAIIIQGKISDGEGLETHNKTTNNVYRYFKQRGILDRDILYYNYDTNQVTYKVTDNNLIELSKENIDQSIINDLKQIINIEYYSEDEFFQDLEAINSQTEQYEELIFKHCSERIEIDGIPTKSAIQKAITQDIVKIMGNKPANLYIVMVDHGNIDTFYIYPDTITDKELAQWYTELENTPGWNQEIITILGFCFSGSFIDSLSKRNRIIITSADSNEFSYKGPLDKDNIREGEYFISELFKSASYGKTLKEAFIEAVVQTEIFTAKEQKNVNDPPHFDNSSQHPLLDDNGDGVGSNILSEISGDGQRTKNISLGVSPLTANNPGDVFIKNVSEPVFLGYTETTTNDLWAEVSSNKRLLTLWIEVKSPDYEPISSETEQIEMKLPKIVTNIYFESTNRYYWNENDLKDIFQHPGTYQILYFAKDKKTKNVSQVKHSIVYKASSINTKPNPFLLLTPKDGTEITSHGVIASCSSNPTPECYTMFTWEYAEDPDDDILSYTLSITKDNKDFDKPVTQRYNNLYQNFAQISIPDDWDGSIVYWKVQAIDKYGAIRDSNIYSFKIDNTYNPSAETISGYVFDSVTQMPIENAKVTVDNSPILTDIRGSYSESFRPGPNYKIIVNKEGYNPETRFPVLIPSQEIFFLNPKDEYYISDIDLNGTIDLCDIIKAMKVLSGIHEDIQSEQTVSLSDILFIFRILIEL